MQIESVEISKINPAPYNPRKDLKPGDPEYEKLKKSIYKFDMVEPLVWNVKSGNLVGGHQRLKILQERGETSVYVSVVNLDDADEKALNLALNKISGEWDEGKLSELLGELSALPDFDIELTGFDADELASLNPTEIIEDGFDVDQAVDEIEKPITKYGDIIQLGKHRLMCGDSTKREDVERLMESNRVHLVFTDMPYGIDKKGIANDSLKGQAWLDFNDAYIRVLPVFDNAGFICYHSTRTFNDTINIAKTNGWKFEKLFFLYRPDKFPVHTWNGWMMTSQAILLFSKGKTEYYNVHPAHQDVYRVTSKNLESKKVLHPTVKPVTHLVDVMKHFVANDVYDPFIGSGSTLIACEQTNRICYGMELDPIYCDVTIKRWEEFTNQKAVRL